MCSKESTYSREALEKTKNRYIKQEDAWRHFFAEILTRKINYSLFIINFINY